MDQTTEQQELLVARNNESGQVGVVVGQNPDGTPRMADVKSTPFSELIKFSKGQNPLEAFMSNFMRQAKNPTMFSFFRLPADRYEAIATAMVDLIQKPEENAEMLKPYKVEVDTPKETVEQKEEEAPTQEPEKSTAVKTTPIDPDRIDWAKIEKQWGITRDDLEKSGALNQMVYNHKSPQLFTVTPQFGDEKYSLEAKLSFRTNPDGSYSLVPHFVRNEPRLDQDFKGYSFTKEDKAELRQTGSLGKPVELTDPKTGEKVKCLVSIDKLTNEIEALPVDKIYIKPKVANIDLDMRAIGILKNGGLIREQHVELPNGAKFTADLQYSASKRDIVFVNSDKYRQEQTQENKNQEQVKDTWHTADGSIKRLEHWCKLPLNEQQQADYLAGKKVLVGEGKDRFGNDCTIYFQYNPELRKPETTRVYPDQDKVVGVAEESKTQYAVNNQGKTNEATKNMKEPLQRGQTAPKDDSQQRQQRKPKGPKV
ncbi:DUF4099 domain-containing protein [Paramuribaculum intestinale]|uniref:DUF4099 domain-containing protein n=1 Tax=Paramuribaculum intestinale TaxID=2094151 RepID=UPI000FFE4EF6|nr:DUF4099 domain-containing protein [Paramuribaculum intestinale]RXE60852.1 DUF4099 domain-containing protein [Muribaculaceae bacterium Isolate-004 (NCI)]